MLSLGRFSVCYFAKLAFLRLISKKKTYLLPINSKIMDKSTNDKSMALPLRLRSWKKMAPNRKLTSTLLRLTMDIMEIMALGRLRA